MKYHPLRLAMVGLLTFTTACDEDTEPPNVEPSPEEKIISAADAVYTEDCSATGLCSESKVVTVLGSRMHYREAGNPAGKPILLLHGQPTWAFLWRDIIPALPPDARIIAPDTIGYGFSESPDIEYSWLDHVRYMEAFIQELGLTEVTLVVHDLGSFQGLAYAERNPQNVAGIVMIESILGPFPALDQFPVPPGPNGDLIRNFVGFLETVRSSPSEAERLIVDEHVFVEGLLDETTVGNLSEEVKDAYRLPFATRESRFKQIQVPLGIPLGGEPADNHELVSAYAAYLGSSEVPKLLLYGEPGFIIAAAQADAIGAMLSNTEVESIGPGLHFVQEDQPEAIALAVSRFFRERVWR